MADMIKRTWCQLVRIFAWHFVLVQSFFPLRSPIFYLGARVGVEAPLNVILGSGRRDTKGSGVVLSKTQLMHAKRLHL